MSGINWHPSESQFVLGTSGALVLHEAKFEGYGKSFTSRVMGQCPAPGLSCMDYGEKGLIWGSNAGSVTLVDWPRDLEKVQEITICPGSTSAPATSVSWNPSNTSQVSAGFDLHKDFCVLIWDVEYASGNKLSVGGKGTAPVNNAPLASVNRLCYEEAISSLCWMGEATPYALVVGTSTGWLRVFDTRIGSSSAETSLMAHTPSRSKNGVSGLRPDPFNPQSLASFSETVGEPVKLWDLRKGTASKSKMAHTCTVHPQLIDDSEINEEIEDDVAGGGSGAGGSRGGLEKTSSSRIVDVLWSQSRANVLAIATEKQVQMYSTAGESSGGDIQTYLPFSIPFTSERQIRGLGWKPESHHVIASCYNEIRHFRVIDTIPLGFNGNEIVTTSTSNDMVLSKVVSSDNGHEQEYGEVEHLMRERSCAGYSFDAGKNLQVLSEELDSLYALSTDKSPHESAENREEVEEGNVKAVDDTRHQYSDNLLNLSRVWGWIDRVERLHDENINLTNCGVLDIFEKQPTTSGNDDAAESAAKDQAAAGEKDREIEEKGTKAMLPERHPVFNVPMYTTDYRESARLVCGWSKVWSPPEFETKASSMKPSDEDTSVEEDFSNLDLEALVEECESLDYFERAAAIAVWHGNIDLAVDVLNRNITSASRAEIVLQDEYVHLVSMVAMCFAGFNTSRSAASANASLVNDQTGETTANDRILHSSVATWVKMCSNLLVQLQSQKRRGAMYIAAVCRFMLHVLRMQDNIQQTGGAITSNVNTRKSSQRPRRLADTFQYIIDDKNLYLEDRVAFACFFLTDEQVVKWLSRINSQCRVTGSLEGLIITGLKEEGISILQEYVDRFQDIQSAALLMCRELGKPPDKAKLSVGVSQAWMWLHEYRNLLNRWQLFVERAALDVELGNYQRNNPKNDADDVKADAVIVAASSGAKPRPSTGLRMGNPMGGKVGQSDKRTMYALPAHNDFPHVYLRCHYCKESLPIDAMQNQQQTALLRKQKPIINFCPKCKKPLPRCYVCQLYMGFVNPHAEVNRILAERRRSAERGRHSAISNGVSIHGHTSGGANMTPNGEVDTLDTKAEHQHNVLDFGRWLYFCQKCKHGGHASCIESWFEGDVNFNARSICGVNGCDCRCMDP